MNTFQKIYEVVGRIPEGSVATYGQVAAMAGNPRWARVVGYALHVLPDPAMVPWHRVVAKDGHISTAYRQSSKAGSNGKASSNDKAGSNGGATSNSESLQEALLRSEGVTFASEGRVNLQKHLWKPVDINPFV